MSQYILLSSRAHLDATMKKQQRWKDQRTWIKWSLEMSCAMERNLANSTAAISSGRILEARLPMIAQRTNLPPWCGLASSTWAWVVDWKLASKQCLYRPILCPLSLSLEYLKEANWGFLKLQVWNLNSIYIFIGPVLLLRIFVLSDAMIQKDGKKMAKVLLIL